ncbi:MAG: ABC transporter permease subunit [Oscillospiraceae bacterium]|nr:ABC transporter permease subunit [Oscillospiraceae bacterium]
MRKKRTALLLLIPFLAITVLILSSAVVVFMQSLGYIPVFGLTDISVQYFEKILKSSAFLKALSVSLYLAFISATVAAILGVILAAALVVLRKQTSSALHLIRLPILVPHMVTAVFIVTIFSQTGLLARFACAVGLISDSAQFPQFLYTESFIGVILAYLWKEIPFVAYFVLSLMSSINETLGQAAENLGASPLHSFFQITLPLTMPAILNAFLIIFIFAFGGYELPAILGPTLPKALPILAYLEFSSPDLLNRPYAMAANAVILFISCTMAALYFLCTRHLVKKLGGEHI